MNTLSSIASLMTGILFLAGIDMLCAWLVFLLLKKRKKAFRFLLLAGGKGFLFGIFLFLLLSIISGGHHSRSPALFDIPPYVVLLIPLAGVAFIARAGWRIQRVIRREQYLSQIQRSPD